MNAKQDNVKRRTTIIDFVMVNDKNETIKCSFKKIFEYNATMYVAFEDTTETVFIFRVKDPYSSAPKLVEIPNDHKEFIHNYYKALIGELLVY